MASHSPYVWHVLHYTRHNVLTLWHQATIFMKPHSLYLTSYILYLCHHTHCLGYITPTKFLRSHPLYMMTSYPMYMTSQPLNVCHHTHSFNGITHFVFRTSHPLCVSYLINCIKHYLHILWHHTTLFMRSHALYSWYHPHYLWNGIHHICFILDTIHVSMLFSWNKWYNNLCI